MIYGTGIDIIDIKRIRRVIRKYGNRFKKRCFSDNEIERSDKRLNSIESYAKRYAAKEACAKALGTGLARGVFWKDIEVVNNQNGKLALVHGSKMFMQESTYTVTPKVGDFYFFPNYLMHTVYPFSGTNDERRSVSFNAMIDDDIFNVFNQKK